MAARLNNDGTSFDSAAENLARTAQVKMSGEQLRKLIIQAGKAVIASQQRNEIPTSFQAADCRADPINPSSPSRIYTGGDGAMVSSITDLLRAIAPRWVICETEASDYYMEWQA